MMPVDSATLLRRDDPLHEYRRIILYQNEQGRGFEIWETIGFAKDGHDSRRAQVAIGGESEIRTEFDAYLGRLENEGFVKTEIPPER
jgi:hypothetical protein